MSTRMVTVIAPKWGMNAVSDGRKAKQMKVQNQATFGGGHWGTPQLNRGGDGLAPAGDPDFLTWCSLSTLTLNVADT